MHDETTDAQPQDDAAEQREADAAAAEAGAIGGRGGSEGLDEAERPLAESGEGVAEGFEQAEADLEANATHAGGAANPLRDAGDPESERDDAAHGEPDHVHSTGDEDSPADGDPGAGGRRD